MEQSRTRASQNWPIVATLMQAKLCRAGRRVNRFDNPGILCADTYARSLIQERRIDAIISAEFLKLRPMGPSCPSTNLPIRCTCRRTEAGWRLLPARGGGVDAGGAGGDILMVIGDREQVARFREVLSDVAEAGG